MTGNKQTQTFKQLSAELLEQLKQKCYGAETLDNYRRTLSRIGKFMEREGFSTYTNDVGYAFIANRVSESYISKSHAMFLRTVIRRLNDVNAGISYRFAVPKQTLLIPPQFSRILKMYLQHCSCLGNKDGTIARKCSICCEFLCSLSDLGCADIDDIDTGYVCKAIVRHTNKDAYAIVRSFLHYLYETGTIKIDYSGVIPKHSRRKVLPTTYTIEEVRHLETAVDRSSKAGKRDYAALLLATRLGLRSGDIVGLTFEKIDFTKCTIRLTQEKTNQPLELPLLPEIKSALEEYIQAARPNSSSECIFLSVNAPFERMTTSTMRRVIAECFTSAGIDTSEKKHGLHSMRSSLASSMVNEGVSYEVVRRLLGHSDPDAIKHYAKIDIEILRSCAIEVPPPSGKFEALLEGRM